MTRATTLGGTTPAPLTIGALARQTGVPPKTIRYYEDRGLLPRPERARNGYRLYGPTTVQLLRFVKRARDLGWPPDEVVELLALWRDPRRASSEVRVMAARHVARVDQKIAELQSLRRTLWDLVEHCHGDERPDCPILDAIAGEGEAPAPVSRPMAGRKPARR